MHDGGSNIGKRNKDKIALGRSGMRDFEVGTFEYEVVIKNDININLAWTPSKAFYPTYFFFNLFYKNKQLLGRFICFYFDGSIQKIRLIDDAGGFGFVCGRAPHDGRACGEQSSGARQILFPIPDIRSQCKVGRMHTSVASENARARCRPMRSPETCVASQAAPTPLLHASRRDRCRGCHSQASR